MKLGKWIELPKSGSYYCFNEKQADLCRRKMKNNEHVQQQHQQQRKKGEIDLVKDKNTFFF